MLCDVAGAPGRLRWINVDCHDVRTCWAKGQDLKDDLCVPPVMLPPIQFRTNSSLFRSWRDVNHLYPTVLAMLDPVADGIGKMVALP